MKEKFYLNAKVKKIDKKIKDAIKKAGIQYPHSSLAFFKARYARLNETNKNDVMLADSVKESIKYLIGCQMNQNHYRKNYIMGEIIDAYLVDNEIEIVFSFHKDVYEKEYEEALKLMNEDKLHVSFELTVEEKNIEVLEGGSKKLNKVEWSGVGLLFDLAPACPDAHVLQTAMEIIENAFNQKDKQLVFASAKEISKHWTKIGEMLEKVLTSKEIEEAKNSYICECLICKKVIKSSSHCKDEKCPDCGGEMRRKDRSGSGDKASLDKNLQTQKTEKSSKEEIEVDKKTKDALLAKFKEDVTKELGEEAVKDWTNEQWVAELEKRAKAEKSNQEKEEAKKLEEKAKKVDAKKSTIVTEEKMITTETYDEESGEYKTDRVGTRVVTRDGKVSVDEKFDNSVIYTYAQVEEIKAEYEKQLKEKDEAIVSKDEVISTKEKVIESAKQIIETRQELGEFAKDLSDEDILDESKVEEAKSKKENAQKVEKVKEELKDNEFAKDFSDEDYLNEDKIENAKLKKENADLKSKKEPIVASKKKDEKLELDASTNNEDKELKSAARRKFMKKATGQIK